MEHIKFPENSPALIVIPSNKEGTGFLKYCYDERHLKGKITEEDFDNVVEQAAKLSAKAYSKKKIMDKGGVGRMKGGCISLCFLLTFGYLVVIMAAADSNSNFLAFLSYLLFLPSIIIMSSILFKNWFQNIKYFVTFEEITKADLDHFFLKINTEKYISEGLEWSTAQLGHFWIELRIKNPNMTNYKPSPSQDNNFMKNEEQSMESDGIDRQENDGINRQLSEENRLVDYNDEVIDKISEKRSEISGLSSRRWKNSNWSNLNWEGHANLGNRLLADSISEESERHDNDSSYKKLEDEVIQLVEDEKELENFKTAKSSEIMKHEFVNNQGNNDQEKSQEVVKNVNLVNDCFGLEDLDLLE